MIYHRNEHVGLKVNCAAPEKAFPKSTLYVNSTNVCEDIFRPCHIFILFYSITFYILCLNTIIILSFISWVRVWELTLVFSVQRQCSTLWGYCYCQVILLPCQHLIRHVQAHVPIISNEQLYLYIHAFRWLVVLFHFNKISPALMSFHGKRGVEFKHYTPKTLVEVDYLQSSYSTKIKFSNGMISRPKSLLSPSLSYSLQLTFCFVIQNSINHCMICPLQSQEITFGTCFLPASQQFTSCFPHPPHFWLRFQRTVSNGLINLTLDIHANFLWIFHRLQSHA